MTDILIQRGNLGVKRQTPGMGAAAKAMRTQQELTHQFNVTMRPEFSSWGDVY